MRRRYSLAGVCALAIAGGLSAWHAVAAPGTPSPAAVDARDQAVARWLGHAALVGQWREVKQGASDRYQARVAGLGLVEVDARSHEVDEVIFEANLTGGAAHPVSNAAALATASTLAAGHYAGFAGLQLRHSSLVDHGVVSEYRFEWQARSGQAWTPSRVTVGINAATGKTMSYWSERGVVTVPTTATVTAAQARADALHMFGAAKGAVADASLEVVSTGTGAQRLVWITQVQEAFVSGAHIPNSQIFWTDAQTGQTELVART